MGIVFGCNNRNHTVLIAFAIWTLRRLFDDFQVGVEAYILGPFHCWAVQLRLKEMQLEAVVSTGRR